MRNHVIKGVTPNPKRLTRSKPPEAPKPPKGEKANKRLNYRAFPAMSRRPESTKVAPKPTAKVRKPRAWAPPPRGRSA